MNVMDAFRRVDKKHIEIEHFYDKNSNRPE